MGRVSADQRRKTLAKQMSRINRARAKERQELSKLPEIEKIKLEIDELKYYLGIRYEGENNSKTQTYKVRLADLQKKLEELENGPKLGKEIQNT